MRLIDADRLLNPGYTNMFDEPMQFDWFSRKAIETEPTVEAIPIEWLEKYIWSADTHEEKETLRKMYISWEKENGRSE